MALRKGAAVLVSLLALGIYVPAAGADPLSMTFTEARANVGKQLFDAALFAAPDTAPFSAQIDPGSGAINNGTLGVPDFETFMTSPIEATVSVDFDIQPITGTFDQGTGALNLAWVGAGTLTATNESLEGEQCHVLAEPSPLMLTTAGSSGGTTNPRSGVPFAAGLNGSGAIAAEWEAMSATPVEASNPDNVSFCNNVENQIGGPGGIWLQQEGSIPPQSPPPPSTGTDPPATCVVPKLAGKKLGRAKAALRKANCGVGKVSKPKHEKGKRRGALVVKSFSPAAGTSLPAGTKVNLQLGHRHHKPRS